MPRKKKVAGAEQEMPEEVEEEEQEIEEEPKPESEKPLMLVFESNIDEIVYTWYTSLATDERYNIYVAAEKLQMPVRTFEESLHRLKGKQLPEDLQHITPS